MESSIKEREWKHETRHIVAILDLLGASEIIGGKKSEIVMNGISNMFRDAESKWPFVEHAPVVFGVRILLGILYAGPTLTVDGKIVVKDIPTAAVPMAEMKTMMNLGYVIKIRKAIELFEMICNK